MLDLQAKVTIELTNEELSLLTALLLVGFATNNAMMGGPNEEEKIVSMARKAQLIAMHGDNLDQRLLDKIRDAGLASGVVRPEQDKH